MNDFTLFKRIGDRWMSDNSPHELLLYLSLPPTPSIYIHIPTVSYATSASSCCYCYSYSEGGI